MNQRPPRPAAMPVTPISPGDLTVIGEMLRGYLMLVRLRMRASPEREAYLQEIEYLRRRLTARYQDNTSLPLTFDDIEIIEAAMYTFETVMSLIAPATKERDANIQASKLLRQRIAAMRTHSGVPPRRQQA